MDYRRALREKDREAFDRLLGKARQHASAASYAARLDPTDQAFLSILLEMEKDIQSAKDMYMYMHTQDVMAKNIAVADDVYEMLAKEKREGESFSDVIRRWRRGKGSLMDAYGLWADIPEKEWKEMEAAIFGADRPASEELRRRKIWK
jgi:predicted CopG family antitoxin